MHEFGTLITESTYEVLRYHLSSLKQDAKSASSYLGKCTDRLPKYKRKGRVGEEGGRAANRASPSTNIPFDVRYPVLSMI